MTDTEFRQLLQEKTAATDAIIRSYLPAPQGEAARVIEAMNYSVDAGGKRLRPLFIAETCAMYGGRQELAAPFIAALELIHTYSLVHDDLPAMDNDDYRRGKLTTHRVYGEGMAVLAGDGLLNYAYETALTAFDAADGEDECARVVRALRVLAENAGIRGMVGGQCADLMAEDGAAGREEITDPEALLTYIHIHKTARMIQSGLQIGAILAGAPEEDIQALGAIGEDIGLAFQIRDDILDVTGDSAVLGKQVGSDEKDGKITYVRLHGLEASGRRVEELTDRAFSAFSALHEENDFLMTLLRSLVTRKN